MTAEDPLEKAKEEVTPSKPKTYKPMSMGAGSGGGGGGSGFFSLGESNIAERAKQLKIERTLSSQSKQSQSENGTKEAVCETETEEDESKNEEKKAKLHEFDSLLICNQVDETENIFHKNLTEGFRVLGESEDVSPRHGAGASQYFATVNFIDPTTKSETTAASSKTNMLQQQSMLGGASSAAFAMENVYENLTFLFDRDYGSTLRSVQYKNMRTGETNIISSLPVRPVLTRNGGSTSSNTTGTTTTSTSPKSSNNKNIANTPWGGGVSTAIVPVSDPSEWHNGPFCHVYIAACENTEHYRTKVRPALRAFVSQLETTASNTTANQQGGHSADYLIVYIPIGDPNKKDSSTSTPSKTNSNSRVGFFGQARRRFGVAASSDENDDAMSKATMDSNDDAFVVNGPTVDGDEYESGSINVLNALQHLSKNERTLYKKIVTDFPNGKVSVISAGSLNRSQDAASEDQLAIRVQEWNVFNRMLGAVIVNGFQDRIKRYKNELKRLDAQRATAVTAARNSPTKPQKSNPYAFNLSHFFLVKESLAFSFEQMQLPGEALLQYDEFRLYMPDLSDKEESTVRRARKKSKALSEDGCSLPQLADAGDFLGFRKKIRTEYDLTAILDIMRRYLFARELSLLFRMEQPLELLSRCQTFIKVMYSILLRGISELDSADRQERKSKAAAWVIQFSWDIYCAASHYLKRNFHSSKSEINEAVACKLRELLEVSRLLLIQLGDDHIGEETNVFSKSRKHLPKDLEQPWSPWIPCDAPVSETNKSTREPLDLESGERQFLVSFEDTLTSTEEFEATYLKLCDAIVDASHTAKQYRLAARIQAEVGEYHMQKGDYRKAALVFQKIVKVYRVDHWDRAHFWRIFRLACCQRTTVEPTSYLKTLCSCFSPRSALVAPKKVLEALFDDLQRVIEHPSVGAARYSRLLFIETSLSVSIPKKNATVGKILDQKQVEKRSCSVGEKIQIPIAIKSHLPGSIELSSVKLFAVAAKNFTTILATGDAIQEEDAAKVLEIDAPVQLQPGENNYSFEWSPSRSGQFILSTVEIVWKQGYFYYDSMDLQEPLLSIDVLPSKPTHSISLEPNVLVPGQDQEVQITFDAGSDIIASGKIILSGTKGISMLPPGTGEWKENCEIDLESYKPGEKQVLIVNVRCDSIETLPNAPDDSMRSNHGLLAKAETTYLHPQTEESDGSASPQSMNATLEAFASVLDKMALSVESIETYWLDANERFLLTILLTSNSASPFSIEEWEIQMNVPITVAPEGDLNESLLKKSISEDDQISFAFECNVGKGNHGELGDSPKSKLRLKLLGGIGKTFSLDIPLNLDRLYSGLSPLGSSKVNDMIQTTLKLDQSSGLVGEPVGMTYTIDPSRCMLSNPLAYSITYRKGEWLVGGKVNGIMEISKSNELSFTGIPIVPGILDHFPTITLESLESSGISMRIEVDCHLPEAFRSIPMTQIIGVASPTFKKKEDGRAEV